MTRFFWKRQNALHFAFFSSLQPPTSTSHSLAQSAPTATPLLPTLPATLTNHTICTSNITHNPIHHTQPLLTKELCPSTKAGRRTRRQTDPQTRPDITKTNKLDHRIQQNPSPDQSIMSYDAVFDLVSITLEGTEISELGKYSTPLSPRLFLTRCTS